MARRRIGPLALATAMATLGISGARVEAASPLPVGRPIPTLGGPYGCGVGVLDDGTVVGTSQRTQFGVDQDVFGWHDSTGVIDVAPGADTTAVAVTGDRLLYRVGLQTWYWSRDDGAVEVPLPTSFTPELAAGDWIGGRNNLPGGSTIAMWHPVTGFAPASRSLVGYRFVDINESGQALITATLGSGRIRAYRWAPSGAITALGNPYGSGADIIASDINEVGAIVGHAALPGGVERAWLWQDGAMTPVGSPDRQARARFINDDGSVTGVVWETTDAGIGFDAPFLWTPRRGFASLPIPAYPVGLTRHDQVVGGLSSLGVAFTRNPVQGYLQLDDAIPSEATAMSDAGRVAGCRALRPHVWDVTTTVRSDWTEAEQARLAQLRTFFGYTTDRDLVKFGVYVLAFINAIDPRPAPTPVTLSTPGTAGSTVVTWAPEEMSVLNAVEDRWALNDEDAHRWGFMVLSFIAAIQGS